MYCQRRGGGLANKGGRGGYAEERVANQRPVCDIQ